MSKLLNVQIRLSHSPQEIFAAWTEADALQQWFCESAEISLGDRRYDFWGRFTPGTPDREAGRHPILDVEANWRLHYSWVHGTETEVRMHIHPGPGRNILVVEQESLPGQDASGVPEDFWFLSLENLRRWLDRRPGTVVRCDFSERKGDIRQAVAIEAPRERVFEALLRPEQLEKWIASHCEVEPRPGGRIDYGWGGGGPTRILEIIPDRKISYSWEPWQNLSETVTTWTLEDEGNGTRLTLVHSGFDPEEPNSGLDTGWAHFLSRIKSLVEYGEDWEPAAKKLTRDEYRYYAKSLMEAQNWLV